MIKSKVMGPNESSMSIAIIPLLSIGHRIVDLEGVEYFLSQREADIGLEFVVNRLHNTIIGQIDITRTQCAVQLRKQHLLDASNSMESYLNSMSGGHDESV